jgi:hypothetical protein
MGHHVVGKKVWLQAELEEPGVGGVVVVLLGFDPRVFEPVEGDVDTDLLAEDPEGSRPPA